MNKHIIITTEQAEQIKGRYGKYSAIEPIKTPDGRFIIPEKCLTDADLVAAKSKIEAANGEVQDIVDLPDTGAVTAGTIFRYNGTHSHLLIVASGHNREDYAHFDPETVPTLFTYFRENSDTLEWIPNEYVKPGWKRVYNGETYEVTAADEFLTVEGQTPDVAVSVWQKWHDPDVIEPWHPYDGTASSLYQTGDKCTFNGHIWESKIDNNSYSPTDYPAGWTDLGEM